jgi:hypothetical protein
VEAAGHLAQDFVAAHVTVTIVDRFEVVDVGHEESERRPAAPGSGELDVAQLEERAARQEARERIVHRLLAQLLARGK